jgi:hypothetical protein
MPESVYSTYDVVSKEQPNAGSPRKEQRSLLDLICDFLLPPIPIVYWALAYFDPSNFFSPLLCMLAASTLLCCTDKNTYMG